MGYEYKHTSPEEVANHFRDTLATLERQRAREEANSLAPSASIVDPATGIALPHPNDDRAEAAKARLVTLDEEIAAVEARLGELES